MSGGDLDADAALSAMQHAAARLNAILESLSDVQKSSRDNTTGGALDPEEIEDDDENETFVHASEWPRAAGAGADGCEPDDVAAVLNAAAINLDEAMDMPSAMELEPSLSSIHSFDSSESQRELPEMLTMYMRGRFRDDADDAEASSRHRDATGDTADPALFVQLTLETVQYDTATMMRSVSVEHD